MSRNETNGVSAAENDRVGRRLQHAALLIAPPLATVGTFLGVVTVAPTAGFLGLLLVSSVAGVGTTVASGRKGISTRTVEEVSELGYVVEGSDVSSRMPTRHLLVTSLYGTAGFGIVAAVFVGVVLL